MAGRAGRRGGRRGGAGPGGPGSRNHKAGDGVAGQPVQQGPGGQPERLGHARLHGHLEAAHVAEGGQDLLGVVALPTDTPPEVSTKSPSAAARANPRRRASGSSRSRPQRKASAPAERAWAASSQELESRIWPGPSGSPGSTSSSPVDTTVTRGRGWTGTTLRPTEASMPMAAGSRTRPRSSTTVPWRTSSPASRTNRRGRGRGAPARCRRRRSSAPPARPCPPLGAGRRRS